MKNILKPTDFSKDSQKAIDYAIQIFNREEFIFYQLHAYVILPSAPDNGKITNKNLTSRPINMALKIINSKTCLYLTLLPPP